MTVMTFSKRKNHNSEPNPGQDSEPDDGRNETGIDGMSADIKNNVLERFASVRNVCCN